MAADSCKLVSLCASADNCPVRDLRFTGNTDVTYENTMISDFAVMCDMYVRHEESIASDLGNAFAACLGTTVNGNAFTDSYIVTDFNISNLSVKFKVLRNCSDNCSRIDLAVLSHLDIRENHSMRINLATITNLYIIIDECIGTDFNVISKNCLRAY